MRIGPWELNKASNVGSEDDIDSFELSEFQKTKPSENASKQTQAGSDENAYVDPKDLTATYTGYGLVYKAVNLRAAYLVGNGFDLVESKGPRAKENFTFCEKFLMDSALYAGRRDYNLKRLSINTDVYGNGHMELVRNRSKVPLYCVMINPESMDLFREGFNGVSNNRGNPIVFMNEGKRTGEPEAWVQSYYEGRTLKWKKLDWNDIVYLSFNVLGDRWLGFSVIQPMLKDVKRIMNITEGYAEAAYRHGFPKSVITYGLPGTNTTPEYRPTPQMRKAANKLAKNMTQSDVVTKPYYYNIEMQSPKITKVNVITDYFLDIVVGTTGIPRATLLGKSEDTNFASIKELNKNLGIEIKDRQDIVKDMFEKQIFPRILPEGTAIPTIKWKEVQEDEDREKVKMIYTLYQPPGAPKGIITREEARVMLKEIYPLPKESEVQAEIKYLESIDTVEESEGNEEDPLKVQKNQLKSNQRKRRSEKLANGDRNTVGEGTKDRGARSTL